MSLVRDIQERGSPGSSAPPKAPTLSSATGFPTTAHRSQRISAFKRARQESKNASSSSASEGPPVVRSIDVPPSATSVFSSPDGKQNRTNGPPTSDVAGILASVQEENEAKVRRMNERERKEELEELEMQIPKNVLDMLRERLRKKEEVEESEDKGQGKEEEEEEEEEEEGEENESLEEGNEDKKDQRDLGGEEGERNLTAGAESTNATREKGSGNAISRPKVSFNPLLSFNKPPPSPPSINVAGHVAPDIIDTSLDDTRDIHDKYFPTESLQQPALEWIQTPLPAGGPNTGIARFDLAGNLLTEAAMKDLPVTKGLHHHGDEAGRAGYTVSEVLLLSSSTFGPQRVIMLGLLGKLAERLDGEMTDKVDLGVKLEEFRRKAFLLACGILGSREKNIGLLREAIYTLSAILGTATLADRVSLTGLVELGSVLARIEDLLEDPILTSRLSPPSILHLVTCLNILAATSTSLARLVAPQVPQAVQNFLLSLAWPDLGRNSEVSWVIGMEVLRLLQECTERHRDMAVTFSSQNVYGSLLKFLAIPPWDSETSKETRTAYPYELFTRVLVVFEKVARYGLQGRLLTGSGDIYRALGTWIQTLGEADFLGDPFIGRIVVAYLNLIRTWTVAATNPHNMAHEHELIWSQIEGFAWADEALHCLAICRDKLIPQFSYPGVSVLSASMNMLTAWLEAVSINTLEGKYWVDRVRDTVTPIRLAIWSLSASSGPESPDLLRFDLLESWARLAVQLKMADGIPSLAELLPALADQAHYVAGRRLLAQKLQSEAAQDPDVQARCAVKILAASQPGEEQEMLKVIDTLLDLKWKPEVATTISHRHGLYILRPFYHCAILPTLDALFSPYHPVGKLLKVITALKPDAFAAMRAGLPLSQDWTLGPLNDLLRPTNSLAFKQVPPAWDASPLEVVQATLAMCRAIGQADVIIGRANILLNLMKVFMLELVPDPENEQRAEIFRDPIVSGQLSAMLSPLLSPGIVSRKTDLETASEPLLGSSTTFFQWYSDFHELYQSVSFSDRTFGQLLLPPLAQAYPVDYRRLFWSEQPGALRALRLTMSQVPLETGSIKAYFIPAEDDQQVLTGYLTAIVKGMIAPTTHEFLYSLAIWHVANAVWRKDAALKGQQVRAALTATVWDDILRCDCAEGRADFRLVKARTDIEMMDARIASLD